VAHRLVMNIVWLLMNDKICQYMQTVMHRYKSAGIMVVGKPLRLFNIREN
jgi:hypothetical protein